MLIIFTIAKNVSISLEILKGQLQAQSKMINSSAVLAMTS